MTKPRLIGLAVFASIILVVIGWQLFPKPKTAPPKPTPIPVTEVTVIGGSEKQGLMENAEVIRILEERYHLRVDFTRMGSIEQVSLPTDELQNKEVDALWPSNSSTVLVFDQNHQRSDFPAYHNEVLLRSPIVLYSWPEVVDALIAQGIVEKVDDTYYIVDMTKLLEAILAGTRWEDFGTRNIMGPVNINSSDPTRSNSGNMLYMLYTNLLAEGDIATPSTTHPILPTIRELYNRQGLQSSSSGFAFESFVALGSGANPILGGYESQLLEFSALYPDLLAQNPDSIRILYPKPTVWSDHPMISLTPEGRALLEALKDPEIQRIAWQVHGFRSGIPGQRNDVSDFPLLGIPQDIFVVVPLPAPEVITLVNSCLVDVNTCQ